MTFPNSPAGVRYARVPWPGCLNLLPERFRIDQPRSTPGIGGTYTHSPASVWQDRSEQLETDQRRLKRLGPTKDGVVHQR